MTDTWFVISAVLLQSWKYIIIIKSRGFYQNEGAPAHNDYLTTLCIVWLHLYSIGLNADYLLLCSLFIIEINSYHNGRRKLFLDFIGW